MQATALTLPPACALRPRYVISVCRKLGLQIFLLWEDIVEVNPKAMVQLAACIMSKYHK